MSATTTPTLEVDSRNLAVAAHLSGYSNLFLPAVAPILIPALMIMARPQDPVVREHAAEALNFQISLWLWAAVFGMASAFLIGLPFLFGLFLMGLILPAIGAMEASKGNLYRYPFTLRLIR